MPGLQLASPEFAMNGRIPAKYTCDGSDVVNPPLVISNVPQAAHSLVLIMDDPDAPVGTWVHWVVWNIPALNGVIAENHVPVNGVQGRNSWQRNSYGGPCPPSGRHRYFFKLYALDTGLALPVTADKAQVERAMHGHIIAETHYLGTYQRH